MHSLKRTNAPLTHMTRISIIGLYHSLTERFENRFGKPRGDRRRERVGEEVGQIVCQRDVQHIGDVCGDLRVLCRRHLPQGTRRASPRALPCRLTPPQSAGDCRTNLAARIILSAFYQFTTCIALCSAAHASPAPRLGTRRRPGRAF